VPRIKTQLVKFPLFLTTEYRLFHDMIVNGTNDFHLKVRGAIPMFLDYLKLIPKSSI